MRSAHDDCIRDDIGASLLDGGNQKMFWSFVKLNRTENMGTAVYRYSLIQGVCTLLAKPKQRLLTISLCKYS